MNKNEIVNEICKVVTASEVFNLNDFGDNYVYELKKMITDWVEVNNVENVEFTVDAEGLGVYLDDPEEIKNFTKFNVKLVEGYSDIWDKMREVLDDNYEGPGWDGFGRCDDRWNEEYLFTGSDCTHYVLVHKMS